jgi:hypothetical protein
MHSLRRCRVRRVALAAPLLVALLPAAARALTVSLELSDGDALVSRAECVDRAAEDLSLSWDLGSSSGASVQILASDASGCSETDATTAVLVDGLSTSQTSYPGDGDGAFTVSDVLESSGESAGTCDGDDFRVYVCVRLLDSSGDAVATGSAALRFQLERPPAPVAVAATPGEHALHLGWSAGTAATGATASSATYRAFASDGTTTASSGETSETSLRLDGLANGTTYQVWVVAYSEAGNPSDASVAVEGTPAPVDDFFELYRKAGGSEEVGCGSAGSGGLGALAPLLALLPALRARRRRPRRPGGSGRRGLLLLGALALLAPAAARADSPRLGAVEVGVGSYRPSIDSELGGTASPYSDVFGSRPGPMFRLGISWAVWTAGPLQLELGLRTGFFHASGKGRLEDGTASDDDTTFNVLPTGGTLTGRLELTRYHVPLEPYVRLGLERYSWWVTDGSGKIAHRGATHGWSAAAGLALPLSALDPVSAAQLDAETGINDLLLYLDVGHAQVDDLGAKKSWNLSDRGLSVTGGLLVAF